MNTSLITHWTNPTTMARRKYHSIKAQESDSQESDSQESDETPKQPNISRKDQDVPSSKAVIPQNNPKPERHEEQEGAGDVNLEDKTLMNSQESSETPKQPNKEQDLLSSTKQSRGIKDVEEQKQQEKDHAVLKDMNVTDSQESIKAADKRNLPRKEKAITSTKQVKWVQEDGKFLSGKEVNSVVLHFPFNINKQKGYFAGIKRSVCEQNERAT